MAWPTDRDRSNFLYSFEYFYCTLMFGYFLAGITRYGICSITLHSECVKSYSECIWLHRECIGLLIEYVEFAGSVYEYIEYIGVHRECLGIYRV